MNVSFNITDVTFDEAENVFTVTGGIADPLSKYTTKSIASQLVGKKVFIVCSDAEGGVVYSEFDITELVTAGRKSFTVKLHHTEDATGLVFAIGSSAFICSVGDDGVYDLPDASYLNVSAALVAWTRNMNISKLLVVLNEQIAAAGGGAQVFTQLVYIADVQTDETAEAGRQHVVQLEHRPSADEVIVEINGIRYYENELDGAGDFVVDRENKLLYLDAYLNDFSYEDLVEAAAELRVIYTIDENDD